MSDKNKFKKPEFMNKIGQIDSKKTKKILVGIGLTGLVCLLFGGMYAKHKIDSNEAAIAAQAQQIAGLKNKIAVKKAANNRKIEKATQQMTGLNYVRKDKDDALMGKFLEKACTWENADQYRQIRQEIMDEYGLSPKSSFMTVFMPKLTQDGVKIGSNGSNGSNEISRNGENMKYNDMTSYVTDISGNDYSYLTIATVESHDKKGAVADGTIVLRYTINGNNKITKLNASAVGYTGQD